MADINTNDGIIDANGASQVMADIDYPIDQNSAEAQAGAGGVNLSMGYGKAGKRDSTEESGREIIRVLSGLAFFMRTETIDPPNKQTP